MEGKQAYIQKIKDRLVRLAAEIDMWKAKAQKANAGSRVDIKKTIDRLLAKKEIVEKKLQALEEAGDDSWELRKSEVEESVKGLVDPTSTSIS